MICIARFWTDSSLSIKVPESDIPLNQERRIPTGIEHCYNKTLQGLSEPIVIFSMLLRNIASVYTLQSQSTPIRFYQFDEGVGYLDFGNILGLCSPGGDHFIKFCRVYEHSVLICPGNGIVYSTLKLKISDCFFGRNSEIVESSTYFFGRFAFISFIIWQTPLSLLLSLGYSIVYFNRCLYMRIYPNTLQSLENETSEPFQKSRRCSFLLFSDIKIV